MPPIIPCLWFADNAEEAVRFYLGIFPDSRTVAITRYGSAGFEIHQRPAGSVMTIEFELGGQRYTALNGGPAFSFNEAVSLQVMCKDQKEIDYYWEALGQDADPAHQQCGWLKDKFGLSWQVVPEGMEEMFTNESSPAAARAMNAMLGMKKIDVAELERASKGE